MAGGDNVGTGQNPAAPEPPSYPSAGGLDIATPERDVRPSLPYILPFAVFIGLMIVEPWLGEMVAPVMDPRWLYAVRSVAAAACIVVFWGRYAWGPGVGSTGAAGWALGAAAGVGVFLLWIGLDFPPLVTGEGEALDPMVEGRIHAALVVSRFAGSALVVPVIEELFWRAFLLRWIHHPRFEGVVPSSVGWKAVLVSSALFATEHRLWFAGLLAGLVYAELYRRTEDLRVPVMAHALTNALLGAWVVGTGAWGFW